MNYRLIARWWFRVRRFNALYILYSAAVLTYLLVDKIGWWVLAIIPPGVVLLWAYHRFDSRYGLPMESETTLKDNREWRWLVDTVERMERKVR